jgi:hypothetical protein
MEEGLNNEVIESNNEPLTRYQKIKLWRKNNKDKIKEYNKRYVIKTRNHKCEMQKKIEELEQKYNELKLQNHNTDTL